MSESVIQIDDVSKLYRLGVIGGKRLVDDVSRQWAKLRGKPDPLSKVAFNPRLAGQMKAMAVDDAAADEIWALRGVSFEVKKGEVLGIIGRNGAGKSTLLKILSRVTAPTRGEVRVNGRIASLLEVGTGFHPELTGRENVFLNGAILGMTKSEIRRRFDEIVEFSEIEKFIDTPVKRYSSGMYVRLAFSVAAHLDAEIMIVDEVLAVGDIAFQQKCIGKMKDAAAKEGSTVLFVSHNLEAVMSLTNTSILLDQGTALSLGPTRDIVAQYLHEGKSSELIYEAPSDNLKLNPIRHVEMTTSLENNIQKHAEPMEIKVQIEIDEPVDRTRFQIYALDEFQQRVFLLWRYDRDDAPLFRKAGKYTMTCKLPKLHLYAGKYSLAVYLADRYKGRGIEVIKGVCPFEVIMAETRADGWPQGEGRYIEDADWEIIEEV